MNFQNGVDKLPTPCYYNYRKRGKKNDIKRIRQNDSAGYFYRICKVRDRRGWGKRISCKMFAGA